MKFRFFSDVHLERDAKQVKRPTIYDLWSPSEHQDDPDTVLILAGDIWNGIRPLSFANQNWLGELAKRFKAVVAVLGNHDYWGDNIATLSNKWQLKIKESSIANVHLLELADGPEHGVIVIDGIRILGTTLWTNFNKSDPSVIMKYDFEKGFDGRALWNDQNFIRTSTYKHFTARHWYERHQQTIANLKVALQQGEEDILLVTHHAPCMLSTLSKQSDPLSCHLYGSDLSDLILDHPRVKQVIHGHTHTVQDYMMGDVRIRCNPRGYAPDSLVGEFSRDGFGSI